LAFSFRIRAKRMIYQTGLFRRLLPASMVIKRSLNNGLSSQLQRFMVARQLKISRTRDQEGEK
jgi:hypothetical protein